MVDRREIGFWLRLVLCIAATTLPDRAKAQTTAPHSPVVSMARVLPITRNKLRVASESGNDSISQLTISRSDCRDDELKYTFRLEITDPQPGYRLEAWTGPSAADCAAQVAAGGAVLQTCWRLEQELTIDATSSPAKATASYTPKQLFGIGQTSGTPFLTSCDDRIPELRGQQKFGVYFLITTQGTVMSSVKTPIYYAFEGPLPPTDIAVSASDSRLHVAWSEIEPVVGEVAYQFYCAPNEADSNSGGCFSSALARAGAPSGDGSDADANAATSSTSSQAGLATSESASSANPTVAYADPIDCGRIEGKANSNGDTSKVLQSNVSFAVSVAVMDRYGNLGPLSRPRCATPFQLDMYNDEDGGLSGRACAIDRHQTNHPKAMALGALLLLGLRRRRKAFRSR